MLRAREAVGAARPADDVGLEGIQGWHGIYTHERMERLARLAARVRALTGLPHANPFPVGIRWDSNPLRITLCFETGLHSRDAYEVRHVTLEDDPATFPSDTLMGKIACLI